MPSARTIGRLFGVGLLAHGVASLAGAVVLVALAQFSNPSFESLGILPVVALTIFVAGMPGFALLRLALRLTNLSDWRWFVAAGATNGALFAALTRLSSRHPFDFGDAVLVAISVIVGGSAGAVYRRVERGLLSEREGGE